MRYFLATLFHPGEMQSIYFLDRESAGVWRYYGIVRTGRNASPLATGHAASSANRAVAFYRSLAGIPTDQEPPAVRFDEARKCAAPPQPTRILFWFPGLTRPTGPGERGHPLFSRVSHTPNPQPPSHIEGAALA
jgi:hypothetical protein